MNVGVVGVGVVGGACKFGFELLGHNVSVHDIVLDTTMADVMDTEVVYICVPTPRADDGSCDISIVHEVIVELQDRGYNGIVAIKSTVVPGTTESLREETGLNVCFVPEFLRERCAITDLQRIMMYVLLDAAMIRPIGLLRSATVRYQKSLSD